LFKYNLLKFCNSILNAHKIGAFGGKSVLWDFIKDMVQNLNRDNSGHFYSKNNKSFVQVKKGYKGKRMHIAFNLNYCRPNYSTIKKDHRRGVQFVLGECKFLICH